jgi:hypothetical protein
LHIVRCLSVVFHSGSKHFGVRLPACLAMPGEKKSTAGAKAKAAKVLAGAEAVEHEAAESADGDRTAATAAPQASVTESSAPDDNLFERLFEGDGAAPAVAKAGSTPATAAPAASQAEPAAPAVAKAGSTPATAAPAASQAEPKALSAAPVAATAGPTATATAGPKADAAAPAASTAKPLAVAAAPEAANAAASLRMRWRWRAAMHPRLRSRRWAVQLSILTYL